MPELSSTVRFTLLRTDLSLPDREAHPLIGAYAAFVLLEADRKSVV